MQLDAYANEQSAILADLGRTLATDVIGPHASPAGEVGFEIGYEPGEDPPDLTILGGCYYVDGICCDADRPEPLVSVPPDDGGGHRPAARLRPPRGPDRAAIHRSSLTDRRPVRPGTAAIQSRSA